MANSGSDLAKKLQAIINTAIDGIITIDHQGIVESFNPAAAKLFEYQPEEIIGKNIKMLMPSPYHQEHDGYIKRYNETKKPKIIGVGREVHGITKSGRIFDMHLGVSEVILNDRIIYTGIIHDLSDIHTAIRKIADLNNQLEQKVSERTYELEKVVNKLLSTNSALENEIKERQIVEKQLKEHEAELNVALEKEKELGDLKSRFVSMASHEFRTPLASILSSAALIGRYNQENQHENREKHIDRIKSAVANLTGILNDFLSLGKLDEGKVEVNYKEIKLNDICQGVNMDLSSMLKGKRKINHIEHGAPQAIITDERIIKNILFNLLSNALKYSKDDVNCHIYYHTDHYEIHVQDYGVGIPLEDQKHLFTRFFRASNATNIQGTGLGLNIVRRYMNLLNGHISFESHLGVGTLFKLELPYLKTT